MSSDVIVVGAGQAAAQLCLSLRAGGWRDRILMIGAERFPPYQRPPLSKKFLTERRPPETLLLRPETLWRDQGVELTGGTSEAADAFVNGEIERWARIIKTTGIKGN